MTGSGDVGADRFDWAVAAARAAASKKAEDPIVLDVGELLGITEAFVIVSGANTRQVKTIADEVEEQVEAAGGPRPLRVEGLSDRRWVLIDYGSFVVHVFLDETRSFYDLERKWADAPRVEWEPAADAVPGLLP
jgi:ribosome-associated protein